MHDEVRTHYKSWIGITVKRQKVNSRRSSPEKAIYRGKPRTAHCFTVVNPTAANNDADIISHLERPDRSRKLSVPGTYLLKQLSSEVNQFPYDN